MRKIDQCLKCGKVKPVVAHGLCRTCYQQHYRGDEDDLGGPKPDLSQEKYLRDLNDQIGTLSKLGKILRATEFNAAAISPADKNAILVKFNSAVGVIQKLLDQPMGDEFTVNPEPDPDPPAAPDRPADEFTVNPVPDSPVSPDPEVHEFTENSKTEFTVNPLPGERRMNTYERGVEEWKGPGWIKIVTTVGDREEAIDAPPFTVSPKSELAANSEPDQPKNPEGSKPPEPAKKSPAPATVNKKYIDVRKYTKKDGTKVNAHSRVSESTVNDQAAPAPPATGRCEMPLTALEADIVDDILTSGSFQDTEALMDSMSEYRRGMDDATFGQWLSENWLGAAHLAGKTLIINRGPLWRELMESFLGLVRNLAVLADAEDDDLAVAADRSACKRLAEKFKAALKDAVN